jgi:hypothetical protein
VREHLLKLNGKWVTPSEFHRGGPVGGVGVAMIANTYSTAKPLVSDGLGVMKAQVSDMRAAIQSKGIVGAHVRDNGQIEFTSRKARKQVADMRGLHDNDGSYGE